MRTLLLNPWMSPQKIISWQRAVVLCVLGKVDVLEEYDEEIRSRSLAIRAPAVVRMKKGGVARRDVVRFTRLNVFTRDDFQCQYCGARRAMRELNYDHVIPRARGGKTTWENIVTSCYACNDRKGGRTPEEARMTLRRKPFKPKSLPVTSAWKLESFEVPAPWQPYCDGVARSEPVA